MAPEGASPAETEQCPCGRTLDPAHQYCPNCGRSRTSDGAGGPEAGDGGPLLLLDRSSGPSTTETTVRTGPGLAPRLVGIGLALVGVVLMWSLFRQPTSEVPPEPGDDEEAVADTEPDAEDGDGDGDDADAESQEDDAEDDTASTTTTTAPGPTSSDPSSAAGEDRASDLPSAPIVGEETGLMLAISKQGQPGLQVLDLDSGEVIDLGRRRSRPIGVLDQWLIVLNESDGSTLGIDLDNPEAEPVEIGGGFDEYLEVVEVAEDRLWTMVEGSDGLTLRAIDIDGRTLEEIAFPLNSRFGSGPWSMVRPSELLYDPAGGLYRRTGSGDEASYELVAEGQVLAAGERVAVIRQCDDEFECRLRWYDIRTSGVIGFPSLPPAAGEGFYQLVGGDRWLVHVDWRTGRGQLIEVATARVARELEPVNFFGFGPSGVPVTSDGRWLAEVTDGKVVIVDLDSGDVWPTGIGALDPTALFIENRR